MTRMSHHGSPSACTPRFAALVCVSLILILAGPSWAQPPGPLSPANWTAIGPAPLDTSPLDTIYAPPPNTSKVSGRITGIAADPTNPLIIYVATAGGGVWKTSDGGNTWTPLTDMQQTLSMGAISVAPSKPSVVYAGTGEANNALDSHYGLGILVSSDGGMTWTLSMGDKNNPAFYNDRLTTSQIAVDPNDPTVAYAAMADDGVNSPCWEKVFTGLPPHFNSLYPDCRDTGIWRTNDSGITWQNTTLAIDSQNPWSAVVIDPFSQPGKRTLYAAVGNDLGAAANGVYKSTDGGATWALCVAANTPRGGSVGRIAIAIAKNNGQVLYVTVAQPFYLADGQTQNVLRGQMQQVLVSVDGCRTFQDATPGNVNYLGSQGWYDTTVIVDPTNWQVAYVSGQDGAGSVLRTIDQGKTWSQIGRGGAPRSTSPHADHHGIDFDANNKLLDGDDGGIYRLESPLDSNPVAIDGISNVSWSDLNGDLQTITFVGIGLHPTNPSIAIGGSQDNGTELFGGNLLWTETIGGDGGFAKFSQQNGNRAYQQGNAGTHGNDLQRSDLGGQINTWTQITPVGASMLSGFYRPFIVDPDDGNHLLYGAGEGQVWETRDGGNTWGGQALTTGKISPGVGPLGPVQAIAMAPSNKNWIYFAEDVYQPGAWDAATSRIFFTQDGGATWTSDPAVFDSHVNDVQVDPNDPQKAYAVINRFVATGNVLMTTDGGTTWTSIHGPGLPAKPIWSIQADPASPGRLYVGADDGVYVTNNGGAAWSRMGAALPNARVYQIELSNRLRILGAGTYGRSMWELMVSPQADLAIIKTHTNNFAQGDMGDTYTITVTNVGATATSGLVTVTDILPADGSLTPTAIAGAGWDCVLGTLTCTRSDPLAPGASYPVITLTVNVAPDAPAQVTNTATVSGGGDTNPTNNTANDVTTIAQVVDLTIVKSHIDPFQQGQVGATYTLVVQNVGFGPSNGLVTVTDILPADGSLIATAIDGGPTWTCKFVTLTCTRADVLPAGAFYPPITLTVNVSPTAPAQVVNTAIVSGGGEVNLANDTANDVTNIQSLFDLGILKNHNGNFLAGQIGAKYTITVFNFGPNPTNGLVTVTDFLPAGLTATAIDGGPAWACVLATLTCTTNAVLGPNAAYPPITLTVNVAPNVSGAVVNRATVAIAGDNNPANNLSLDVTTIGSSARTLALDCTTQGNWKGVYGQDGYIIALDSFNPPSYLSTPSTGIFAGTMLYQWAASTTDPRALLKAASTTDRIASAFYSDDNFTLDLNFTDLQRHQVALYLLDYDTDSRIETITFFNGDAPGEVAPPLTVSNFHSGCYVPFEVQGHVVVQVTKTGGANAVVSGVFFRTVPITPVPSVFMTKPTSPMVSGTTTLSAHATSPAGVVSVQFQASQLSELCCNVLSTVNLGAPVTGPGPDYSMQWFSPALEDGSYTLTAIATDALGQTAISPGVNIVVNNGEPSPPSAIFVKSDAVTEGNWKGNYGGDGSIISNDSVNPPAYALVSFSGASQFTWGASTSDVRALLKAASASDRIASAYDSPAGFSIDLDLVGNQPHQIALYFLDWDNGGRVQTISILDADTNALLDMRTISSFAGGVYMVWNLQGHVLIQVARVSGQNAVLSGVFFAGLPSQPAPAVSITAPAQNQTISGLFTVSATAGAPAGIASVQFQLDGAILGGPVTVGPPYTFQWATTTASNGLHSLVALATDNLSQQTTSTPVTFSVLNGTPTSVLFVAADTSTQGTWKGHYGGDGEIIANDSSNPPAYATAIFNGASQFTWATTTAVQALQEANSATNRIASAFYGTPAFTLDLSLTDGQQHQVALYFLDWDSSGRAQTINVLDATTLTVLDTRAVSNFSSGQYLVWNVIGHVIFQFTKSAGPNAVLSGVFLAPPAP